MTSAERWCMMRDMTTNYLTADELMAECRRIAATRRPAHITDVFRPGIEITFTCPYRHYRSTREAATAAAPIGNGWWQAHDRNGVAITLHESQTMRWLHMTAVEID